MKPRFLKLTFAGFLLCLAASSCSRPPAQPGTDGNNQNSADSVLVVASWGGAYQAAQRVAFFEPFEKEFGVRIEESATPPYAKFYEWQRSGDPPVDVADVETFFVLRGGTKGALAPLDFAVIDSLGLTTGSVTPFGVATVAYADVLAWNSRRHPAWKELTWVDFWNTRQFPGPRGLRDLPASSLEAALMADGVARDSLYPLDVDRAFRKLDALRKNTRITLWSSGAAPIEWLNAGTVAMSTAWNGRVFDAQRPHAGAPLPIVMTFPKGAMVDQLWWVVPANAKHASLAMRFIAFTLRPDRQAAIAQLIPYGPTNSAALTLLPDSVVSRLPTAAVHANALIRRDNHWWAQHIDSVEARWRQWKLSIEPK